MRAAIPVSEWTRGVLSAVDRLDAAGFVAHLGENPWLRVGNAPAAVGRDAVRAALADFFAGLRAIDHEVIFVAVDVPADFLRGVDAAGVGVVRRRHA